MPKRMVDEPESPQPLTLKRWSQRKRDAARKEAAPETPIAAAPAGVPAAAETPPAAAPEPPPLPPVESLEFESDYTAFMQPKVNEETRRAALKKLFSDPSFNVMDGLDIYVGDYTQPDPMPAGMLDKLSAVYKILDPVPPPAAPAAPGESSPDNATPSVSSRADPAPRESSPADAAPRESSPADPTPSASPGATPEPAAETPPAPDVAADHRKSTP